MTAEKQQRHSLAPLSDPRHTITRIRMHTATHLQAAASASRSASVRQGASCRGHSSRASRPEAGSLMTTLVGAVGGVMAGLVLGRRRRVWPVRGGGCMSGGTIVS